jgi:SpoVK/Ycf46/Vps4 family AAA+-type ATPase
MATTLTPAHWWFWDEGMSVGYENNWEYLNAELSHLCLVIGREVVRSRRRSRAEQTDMLRGVFISEAEVNQLLGDADDGMAGRDEVEALQHQATVLRSEIRQQRRASVENGVYLSLVHLARIFGLTPFEEQVILICLAPEIDLKFERLYGYLQDDVTRKSPTADLAMKLLCSSAGDKLNARAVFSPQASLFRLQLVRYQDDGSAHFLARGLKLDERIEGFLLGTPSMEKDLTSCLSSFPSPVSLRSLRWPEELTNGLIAVSQTHLTSRAQPARKLVYNFYGPKGTGRKSLAASLCKELDVALLIVDLHEVRLRQSSFEELVQKTFREAVLQPAAIYVEHFDLLAEDDEKTVSQLRYLIARLEEFSWLTFVATEKMWEPAGMLKDHVYLSVELPMPDLKARVELWPIMAARAADRDGLLNRETNWEELAVKFRLTPGQMRDGLVGARNYACLRAGPGASVELTDLHRGCRAQSNQKLTSSARRLTPRHSWPDITLPRNELAQLREVCAQVKHRRKVYDEWGFGHKVSTAKGLAVLFHGPSGTGKTTAVEILANELQLEAYKIDLSTVVSKYIGETEKNLSAIFQEAETSNALLFFDEADSLFGKRSEVKDAHDRYANIEINYLLQRMDEFEGLVILATNLRKNIDEAFFRRMHFAIEFPFPDETNRYHIWKQHIPRSAPVANDIDFNFLAGRLNITGGNIKNIVVNAAFLAAENSGVIHMKHLMRATRREYEKMGRLCTESEFAPYHAMLKND